MTCMFSAFDASCNTCLDGMCMTEKAACCNAMGCVDLVDCVATNCPSGDLNCVIANCSAEIQAAGGPTGPGAMAAQGVATCGASNCPTCLGGQGGGGQGGMGQGGMAQGGAGQGGMAQGGAGQGGMGQGGGGGACTFMGYSNACNMCLDNQCTAEEAACCNTTGCQDLVECVPPTAPTRRISRASSTCAAPSFRRRAAPTGPARWPRRAWRPARATTAPPATEPRGGAGGEARRARVRYAEACLDRSSSRP